MNTGLKIPTAPFGCDYKKSKHRAPLACLFLARLKYRHPCVSGTVSPFLFDRL
jgi:hypothetical protein